MFPYSSLARNFRRRSAAAFRGVVVSRCTMSTTSAEQESLLRSYLGMYDGTKKTLEDVKPILCSVMAPNVVVVTPNGQVGLETVEPAVAKLVEGGAKNNVFFVQEKDKGTWEYKVEVTPGGDNADPMMVHARATFNEDGKVARVEPLGAETNKAYTQTLNS